MTGCANQFRLEHQPLQPTNMKKFMLSLILCLWASASWAFPPGFIGAITQGAAGGTPDPAIAYEIYSSNSGTGTAATFSTPTGTTDGDLLVMVVNEDAGTGITPLAGWTQIAYVDSYASADAGVYYRVFQTGDAVPSATIGSSTEWSGVVVRLSKTTGTWSIADFAAAGTLVPLTVTATNPGMLLFLWGSDDPATINTPPAGMTEVVIVTPASSRAGAWRQNVSSAGDYEKSLNVTDQNAHFLVAIGLTL